MAMTTTSAQTVAIAEVTEHICSYSEGNKLVTLALTSKSISKSASHMVWKNVKMLTDLFPIIPHFLNMTVDW